MLWHGVSLVGAWAESPWGQSAPVPLAEGSGPTWAAAEGAAVYTGALLAWALGLYVLTRGGLRRVPILAGLAVFTTVSYLVGQAVGALAADQQTWLLWVRRSWWAASLAPACWLAAIVALATEEDDTADAAPDPADEGSDASRDHGPRPPHDAGERDGQGTGRAAAPVTWVLGGFAVAGLAAGVAFAVVGTLSDEVVRWPDALAISREMPVGGGATAWHIPPGSLFSLYQVYVVACLLGAAVILLRLWRAAAPGTPMRSQFAWLLGSAVLFLLSGVYITSASGLMGYSFLPGQGLLIAGILIMAWNLARYGALLAGEVPTADFVAFALSMGAISVGYGVLAAVWMPREAAWVERVLPLGLVLMATHVLATRQHIALDRLVYGPVAGRLRTGLAALADRVIRQPDTVAALADVRESVEALVRSEESAIGPEAAAGTVASAAAAAGPSAGHEEDGDGGGPGERGGRPAVGGADGAPPSEIRVLVEGALRHLNDVPSLVEHRLTGYVPSIGARAEAAGAGPLERAALLRAALQQAIERLRPMSESRPTPGLHGASGGWLHYLVLHEAYVEGRPNKQIMQRYYLSEGTFHRARRRAIDALALDLYARGAAG